MVFSSTNHIYLIEKNHPLASYVQILPYELYNYRKFFESMGVKYQPEPSKLEDLLRTQPQSIDENILKWMKETYINDRRLLQLINDFETKSISKGNNKTKNINDEQTRITFSSTLDLSDDKVYLYLPGKHRRTIDKNIKTQNNYIFQIYSINKRISRKQSYKH